ncbi:MAG: class I adenylate-forming enzyme family protein [Myxococcota bacterium]
MPDPSPDQNVAADFLEGFRARPDDPAVCEDGGAACSYGELRRRVQGLAGLLRKRGFRPGDRALIQVPNGPGFAAGVLAVLACGGTPVLCEPGLGPAVYHSRLRAAAPRWLLAHPLVERIQRFPGLRRALERVDLVVPPRPERDLGARRIPVSERTLRALAAEARPVEPIPVAEDHEAVLVFTGGTTSQPKGVLHSHGALRAYFGHVREAITDLRVSRLLADTPPQVLYALYLGRSATVVRGRPDKRARRALRLIRAGEVDACFGPPSIWMNMMAREGRSARRLPATLRTVMLGGAPVTPAFLDRLLARLDPGTGVRVIYGLTEAGPLCTVDARDKLAFRGGGDLVGAPLSGVRLELEPTEGDPEVGEVLAHSPSLYLGYLDEPRRAPGTPLRTGDLGRLVTRRGREVLTLVGRAKDMIVRRGVNIYPGTLEPTLEAARDPDGRPLFREVALIGVWNPTTEDEEVVLVYAPEEAPGPAALDRIVARIVGPDGRPDHYLAVDSLPTTGRQDKVDKAALRRDAAARLGLEPTSPK